MGLFSFIGKAIGTVAKIGLGVATGNVGGAIGTALGALGVAKSGLGQTSATKLNVLGTFGPYRAGEILRGNPLGTPRALPAGTGAAGGQRRYVTAHQLSMSPVLPGGAIATPSGPVGQGGTPPAQYGTARGRVGRKRKRAKATHRRKARGAKKRRGRKLKFGSPAWRKKYLGHR